MGALPAAGLLRIRRWLTEAGSPNRELFVRAAITEAGSTDARLAGRDADPGSQLLASPAGDNAELELALKLVPEVGL